MEEFFGFIGNLIIFTVIVIWGFWKYLEVYSLFCFFFRYLMLEKQYLVIGFQSLFYIFVSLRRIQRSRRLVWYWFILGTQEIFRCSFVQIVFFRFVFGWGLMCFVWWWSSSCFFEFGDFLFGGGNFVSIYNYLIIVYILIVLFF